MLDFTDKVALITGAGGDIGRVTALTLARQGAKVLAVDLDEAAVEATVNEVQGAGGAAEGFRADVTKRDEVRAYAERAVELWGQIDLFYNNAGIEGPGAPITEYPEEGFDQVLAVNVRGIFLGLKHVLPHMKEGGAVVNTASVAGLTGNPGLVGYVASKHAVIGITRTAALELAERGVRVNAVCPGPVGGRMMNNIEDNIEVSEDAFAQTIPLGRYATPQEVANLVTMLLSGEASYLTGGAYTVDGGLTAG